MTFRTAIYCCLACAALAFLVGAVAGLSVAANEKQPRPPAGQQFDDGPVIVRALGSQPLPRFVF